VQGSRYPSLNLADKYGALFVQPKSDLPTKNTVYCGKSQDPPKATESFEPTKLNLETYMDIKLDQFADGDKKIYQEMDREIYE